MRLRTPLSLGLVSLLVLTACGAGGGVAVEDVRARAALADIGLSAIYLDITNDSDEDAELVGAAVPAEIAGSTELHEVVAAGEDGMSGEMDTDDDMEDMDEDTGEMDMDEMDEDMEGMEGMGGMTMRQIDGNVVIPAGETVTLEPGGLHIMVLDLAEDLTEGQAFDVVLEFADGSTQTVEATVTTTP